jgi:2-phospho-L-lactate guanylyltransferase
MAPARESWAVVVPVKRLAVAKSRLDVDAGIRVELALAMALDTVAACVQASAVVLVVAVSDDELAGPLLRAAGAHVVADEPAAGLNPAIRHGAIIAARTCPGVRLAAVAADLPALRPDDLAAVLSAARAHPTGAVADATGVGTTLFAATELDVFSPAFGDDSWRRHIGAGVVDLTATAGASVRRDVDTLDDLRDASAMGCGLATTSCLTAHPELLDRTLGTGAT